MNLLLNPSPLRSSNRRTSCVRSPSSSSRLILPFISTRWQELPRKLLYVFTKNYTRIKVLYDSNYLSFFIPIIVYGKEFKL
jgi:hypothetical protein